MNVIHPMIFRMLGNQIFVEFEEFIDNGVLLFWRARFREACGNVLKPVRLVTILYNNFPPSIKVLFRYLGNLVILDTYVKDHNMKNDVLPDVNVALLQVLVVGMNQRACALGSPPFLSHFSR